MSEIMADNRAWVGGFKTEIDLYIKNEVELTPDDIKQKFDFIITTYCVGAIKKIK